MMSESKPKAKGKSRASKPRTSPTKSPPKAGTKARPGASEAEPLKLLADGNPRIANADAPVHALVPTGKPFSGLTDPRTRDPENWREAALARVRALILEADPEMIEE